uniref:Uncharacterized protein n=1 Tax=Romanomermis culicivorax TaxID=13658 RepID=A0A915HF56_ROMCU
MARVRDRQPHLRNQHLLLLCQGQLLQLQCRRTRASRRRLVTGDD